MFIEQADLLKGVGRRFIKKFVKIMVDESHLQGAFLFKEGDSADNFYILEEGSVKLSIGKEGHITHIVSKRGEAFGWSSLVDRDVYTASAECSAPTKVFKIPREEMNRILDNNPVDGLIFFKRLAGIVGERLINSYNSLLLAQASEDHRTYGSSLTLQQRAGESAEEV